jgi:hypothetical protein
MNSDRRLQNLLFDSELLLVENGPIENLAFKAPSKLRKIIQKKNEQSLPSEPRQTSSLLLNINFPELEKTLEATKTILKFEPVASVVDLSNLSYFPVLQFMTNGKAESVDNSKIKNPSEPAKSDNKIEEYIKYTRQRNLTETGLETSKNMQTARRGVLQSLLKSWDQRLDRVIDATVNSKDTSPYDPQQINIYLPFVTKKMDKVIDTRRFAYINHVYNYIQMSRVFERPKNHREVSHGNILHNITAHNGHADSFDHGHRNMMHITGRNLGRQHQPMNYKSMNYGGQDSISLSGSINEEGRSGVSKIGLSILPRLEKAKMINNLLDEFAMINQNSQESSIFLICKELFKGLDFGPKDSSLSKKEIAVVHVNELLDQSCRILQLEFFEQSKRMSKRRKLENATLNGRQIETVQIVYGYIEEYVLDEAFSMENIIMRDEDGLPVWALLFYLLRAGLVNEFEVFCQEYSGSLISDVRHAFNIYKEKMGHKEISNIEIRSKFESDADGFGLSDTSDVFKRTLASLLGGSEELADLSLLSDMKDYLWFSLFKSHEDDYKHPNYRILDLQKKIKQTEKEFVDNGEILELVKIQILTLMFSEAIDTLHEVPSYFAEAAQLSFICEEARIIKLQRIYKGRDLHRTERSKSVEKILSEFADEIAQRFPIEAIAYLCSISNPSKKAKVIKYFIDKNGLQNAFFNISSESFHLLDKLKSLMNKESFEALLALLSRRSEIEADLLTVSYIRVLEESSNVTEILNLVIEQEYSITQQLRSETKNRNSQFSEGSRHLERLFVENSNKAIFINNELYREVLVSRSIRMLFSLYYEKRNPKACMEYIDGQKYFEVEFRRLGNKLKILYLEFVHLALKVYNEYKESLKVRTLSYDSSIKYIRAHLSVAETYFYEQITGSSILPEKPFSNFDDLERQTKELINALNAIY